MAPQWPAAQWAASKRHGSGTASNLARRAASHGGKGCLEKGRAGDGEADDNSASIAATGDAGRPEYGRPRDAVAGGSARERRQEKRLEQRQHLEQGVAGERELQQKKRKR